MLFSVFFDDCKKNTLFSIKIEYEKWDIKKFNPIIELLVTHEKLIEIVNRYESEKGIFYDNPERTKFFNSINNLYNDIVNEDKIMPKKGMCNSKKCVTRFIHLRYLFSD